MTTKERTYSMQVRGVPRELSERMRAAARARNLTLAEYLGKLLLLHERMRELAVPYPDGSTRNIDPLVELIALGLQPVSA